MNAFGLTKCLNCYDDPHIRSNMKQEALASHSLRCAIRYFEPRAGRPILANTTLSKHPKRQTHSSIFSLYPTQPPPSAIALKSGPI